MPASKRAAAVNVSDQRLPSGSVNVTSWVAGMRRSAVNAGGLIVVSVESRIT